MCRPFAELDGAKWSKRKHRRLALQPIEEISKIVHDAGALLVIDCVTSLGGLPVKIDEWDVDAAYSGTQK